MLNEIELEIFKLILADLHSEVESRLDAHIVDKEAKPQVVVVKCLAAELPQRKLFTYFVSVHIPGLLVNLCKCVCWVA